jgi:hypothetical protein
VGGEHTTKRRKPRRTASKTISQETAGIERKEPHKTAIGSSPLSPRAKLANLQRPAAVGAGSTILSLQRPAAFAFFFSPAAGPAFSPSSFASRPLSLRLYSSKKKSKKMPPKKAPVQEKVLLGRPGNNLKSGIVCEESHSPASLFFLDP